MTAQRLGACRRAGFSTRPVTRTRSCSPVGSTAAQPYRWICSRVRATAVRQRMADARTRHHAWIRRHGTDLPEVAEWSWNA